MKPLQALGNKKGISRYGFLLPMDDVLAQVAIDFSGRPWIVWKAKFNREKVGDMPTELFSISGSHFRMLQNAIST